MKLSIPDPPLWGLFPLSWDHKQGQVSNLRCPTFYSELFLLSFAYHLKACELPIRFHCKPAWSASQPSLYKYFKYMRDIKQTHYSQSSHSLTSSPFPAPLLRANRKEGNNASSSPNGSSDLNMMKLWGPIDVQASGRGPAKMTKTRAAPCGLFLLQGQPPFFKDRVDRAS